MTLRLKCLPWTLLDCPATMTAGLKRPLATLHTRLPKCPKGSTMALVDGPRRFVCGDGRPEALGTSPTSPRGPTWYNRTDVEANTTLWFPPSPTSHDPKTRLDRLYAQRRGVAAGAGGYCGPSSTTVGRSNTHSQELRGSRGRTGPRYPRRSVFQGPLSLLKVNQ